MTFELEGKRVVVYPTKTMRVLLTEKGSATETLCFAEIQVCILTLAVLYWKPPVIPESCMTCKDKTRDWQKTTKCKIMCV